MERMRRWPDQVLTVALLGAAGLIIFIALRPNHPIVKAVTLGWIVLP